MKIGYRVGDWSESLIPFFQRNFRRNEKKLEDISEETKKN